MQYYTRDVIQDTLIKSIAEYTVLRILAKDGFGDSASFSGYGQVPANWAGNLSQALSPTMPSGDFGGNEWGSTAQHAQAIAQAGISVDTPAPADVAGNQAAYADTIKQGQYAMDEQKMSPSSFASRLNTTLKRNKASEYDVTPGQNAPAGYGGGGVTGVVPTQFGAPTPGGNVNNVVSNVPVSSQPAEMSPGAVGHGGQSAPMPSVPSAVGPTPQPATNLGAAAVPRTSPTPTVTPPPVATTASNINQPSIPKS